MTTLDDFFKKSSSGGSAPSKRNLSGKPSKAKSNVVDYSAAAGLPAKARARKAEVSYDDLPSLETKGYDSSVGRPETSYDELPVLTGRSYESEPGRADVNYDELPTLTGKTNYEDHQPDPRAATAAQVYNSAASFSKRFSVNRDDLLKSFILAEVLQPYNINRIYDRIPGIKHDE